MKITITADLRKTDPFGLDLCRACDAAKTNYSKARDIGTADYSKPGAYEHRMAYEAAISAARDCHGVLRAFALAVGPVAAEKVSELSWALATDFNGNKKA